MPKKPGKGGHGDQAYTTKTGQYIKDSDSSDNVPSWLKKSTGTANTTTPKADTIVQMSTSGVDSNVEQPSTSEKKLPKWLSKKMTGDISVNLEYADIVEEVPIEHDDFTWIKSCNEDVKEKFKEYTYEDFKDYLSAFDGEFSEEFLNKLTGEEIEALAIAKANTLVNANKHFMDKIKEIDAEGNKIWLNYPTTLSDLKTSLDKKEEYFNQSLIKFDEEIKEAEEFGYDISDKIPKLEEAKLQANNQLSKIDKIRSEIVPQWEVAYDLINTSNNLVAKYESAGNPYSQTKKNQAKWFKSHEAARAYFDSLGIQETYKEIGNGDLTSVKAYTGSYSSINEPLRKIKYSGSYSNKQLFMDKVTKMTRAIDKSPLKESMWVQRGINQLFINENTTLSWGTSEMELQKLVGGTFVDQGFVSCSAHKGGGFSNTNIILNIYIPKGAKALYVDPISNFHHSSEDEIIIQRGYTYQIKKVEKSNGRIYVDCDVILGSDSKKYSDKELALLNEKYFY